MELIYISWINSRKYLITKVAEYTNLKKCLLILGFNLMNCNLTFNISSIFNFLFFENYSHSLQKICLNSNSHLRLQLLQLLLCTDWVGPSGWVGQAECVECLAQTLCKYLTKWQITNGNWSQHSTLHAGASSWAAYLDVNCGEVHLPYNVLTHTHINTVICVLCWAHKKKALDTS